MSRESPGWSSDAASGTVLMEYLKRASPEFVAAELDKLGLLSAADEAAAAVFERVAAPRVTHRVRGPAVGLAAMVALAMCAVVVAIAETRHFGILPENDGSQFMQLAGPIPEW